MKQFCFFTLFLILTFHSSAQNEKTNWFFGPTNAGLNFNLNTNTITTTNIHYTSYTYCGSSTISDPITGNLLFYTDGKNVIDTTHNVMPNGSGLLGGNSTHSSGLVVPIPNECNKYYIFTITTATEFGTIGNLYYSIIDLNLVGNGTSTSPLGDIVSSSKNILIYSNVAEGLEVAKDTNTGNYWLFSPLNNSNTIKVFKITTSGIAAHSSYSLSSTLTDMQANRYNSIFNKFFIGSFIENEPCLILDFNPSTGFFTSCQIIPGTPFGTSNNTHAGEIDGEWSSDGTKLYISKYREQAPSFGSGKIYQYDLNFPTSNPTLIYSPNTSSQADQCLGLRLGPDNKIYFAYKSPTNPDTYIGCINQPNNAGSACNVNPFQISFTTPITGMTLFPRFSSSINNSVNITGNTTICPGQSTTLTVNGGTSYTWSGGISSTSNSITVTPNSTTTYYVTGSSTSCGNYTDTVIVTVQNLPNINVSGITTICIGQSTTLTASGGISYTWGGGTSSTSNSITVNPASTITYYVAGNSACGVDTDTVTVIVNALSIASFSYSFDECLEKVYFENTSQNGLSFLWNFGDSTYNTSSNPEHYFNIPGFYNVTLLVNGGTSCSSSISQTINIINSQNQSLYLPNVFTPNTDGINDEFKISGLSNCRSYRLIIYNHWGQKIFETENPSSVFWNGTNGRKQEIVDGVYFYILTSTINGNTDSMFGNITVLR